MALVGTLAEARSIAQIVTADAYKPPLVTIFSEVLGFPSNSFGHKAAITPVFRDAPTPGVCDDFIVDRDCVHSADCAPYGYCSSNAMKCAPYKHAGEYCNVVQLCDPA